MLKGKTVVLGVTGSIAAYKIANLASMLVKKHADVHVIMTENATNFINPITFETLTGNKCLVDTFDRNFQFNVEHVALAKRADVFMVAPASANIIGKIAGGIADDMLSTTIMPAKCPKIIAPAMNTGMIENPIVQDNIKKLESYGYEIVESATGYLACGDTGKGKLPDAEVLQDYILKAIAKEKDMAGVRLLVTAGPTLVTGKVEIEPPRFVNVVDITSAQDMYEAVMDRSTEQDVIIKAAAVADYRPAEVAEHKIKKADGDMSIKLSRTKDILLALGNQRIEKGIQDQIICGFSMETRDLIENSRKKIDSKHIDLIAANNLKVAGAGFGVDTNVLTLITRDSISELPMMSKEECADMLLDRIMEMRKAADLS